jgi:F-type H+-transporting ATPase subunit a
MGIPVAGYSILSLASAAASGTAEVAASGTGEVHVEQSMIDPAIIFNRHWISSTFHSVGGHHFIVVIMSLIIILALAAFLAYCSRDLKVRRISAGQNFLELIYESLDGYVVSMMGPAGRNFLVLIGSLFIYILLSNFLGLVPGMEAPTANLNTTLALALVTFFAIHYYGLKTQGLKYLKHFAGDVWWLAPLMIPIHVIGELARPLSLSIRLFGNIRGEDIALCILFFLGVKAYFPFFHTPMMFLACFTSLIQALVFTMLSMAYISGALPHEEHHEEGGHGEDDKHKGAHHHHGGEAHKESNKESRREGRGRAHK